MLVPQIAAMWHILHATLTGCCSVVSCILPTDKREIVVSGFEAEFGSRAGFGFI